jgi:hypothetical protein
MVTATDPAGRGNVAGRIDVMGRLGIDTRAWVSVAGLTSWGGLTLLTNMYRTWTSFMPGTVNITHPPRHKPLRRKKLKE